jgi:hypothetical protein
MSECCLPNLGCLAIPIITVDVAGQAGQNGTDGRGISGESYNDASGELTLLFTSGDPSFTTGDLRGDKGDQGDQGVNGLARLYSMPEPFFESTIVDNWVQQHDYTVAANTLLNLGDSLIINLRSSKVLSSPDLYYASRRRIRWNNLYITPSTGLIMNTADTSFQYNTRIEIIKSDVDKAICLITADLDILSDTYILTQQINLTGLNFGVDNDIYTDLWQDVPLQTYFNSMTIDKIKAV